MIINKIYIKNFGKFNNLTLEFREGLNLLYGFNEVGKSTIHKFIEGMLFGFYKLYLKTKKYTTDYDKYLPWNIVDGYEGALECQLGNKRYRIERNFLKKFDEVKVFDLITGEDITDTIQYNSILRLPEPSSLLIGVNQTIYNNTISISQLNSKTEKELAVEIKDYITNMASSKVEEISVEKILKSIDERLNKLGTERRSQSNKGIIVNKLNQLEEELKLSNEVYEEINNKRSKLKQLKENENKLKNNVDNIEKEIFLIKQKEWIQHHQKLQKLQEEIKDLNEIIEPFEHFKNIDIDQLETLFTIDQQAKVLKEQIDASKQDLEEIQKSLKKNEDQIKQYGFDKLNKENIDELDISSEYKIYKDLVVRNDKLNSTIEQMEINNKKINQAQIQVVIDDYKKFDELEEKKRDIYEKQQAEQLNEINDQKENIQQRMWKLIIAGIVSFCIAFISLVSLKMPLNIIIAFIAMISGGALFFLGYQKKLVVNEVDEELDNFKFQRDTSNVELKSILRAQKSILKKHKVKNINEYKKLREQIYRIEARHNEYTTTFKEKTDEIKQINTQLEELIKKISYTINQFGYQFSDLSDEVANKIINIIKKGKELFNEYDYMQKRENQIKRKLEQFMKKYDIIQEEVQEILKEFRIDKVEKLNKVRHQVNEWKASNQQLESKKDLFNQMIGNFTVEQIRDKIQVDINDVKQVDIEKKDQKRQLHKEIQRKIINITKEIGICESQILELSNKVRPKGEIEIEMQDFDSENIKIDKKIKALNYAKRTLKKISENIHRDFAPQLNEAVNKIIEDITNEKYSKVKVSQNIEMIVKDNKNNKYVPIEQLSHGTIDQMYFSLRLGIMNLVKKTETYPIILDDAFTQYDDNRIVNVVDWLDKQKDKQIIIFTCHNREKQILDNKDSKYHYINLNKVQ